MSRISGISGKGKKQEEDREDGRFSTSEALGLILPMLRDFIPIFLEKLSEVVDRPTIRGLEEENRRLRDRIDLLNRRMHWLAMFQIVQALFFLFFVILVALKIF